jgi:membrane fusion protein, heavy metal efflux system
MRTHIWIWLILVCSSVALVVGTAIGYVMFRSEPRVVTEATPVDHEDHRDHVDVSAMAAKNLGLQFGMVKSGPFRKHLHIPGMVIEKPGQSGLAVTSPIQGIIREIHKFPGQAISPGDLLFSMQVSDAALENTQLALLETLTRIAVTEREISRLDPLAESGAIAGRRKLEMQYQLMQLQSERDARLQELRLRGLSDEQIALIVEDRELVGQIEIRLNIGQSAGDSTLATRLASSDAVADPDRHHAADDPGPIYTVESLDVFPGRAVTKGEELCHIANHHELFLRGEAFESDVPVVRRLKASGWAISAEFGDGDGRTRVDDLSITYMDNHVDPGTQTFPFYLTLHNRVVSEHRDNAGRLFRSWQFKPGQRAHLFVPVEQWTDQIVLPREAVVRAGPDAFVFRLEDPQQASGHFGGAEETRLRRGEERLAALADLPEFEMEPVSIHVLHQDTANCVIAANGELQIGDVVAINQAYQIYLAWKLQMSGGGHDHHDH